MAKNIITPLFIIAAAVLIGGIIFFSDSNLSTNEQLTEPAGNLRALELAVPGMFCAGCTASVEGYVSPMAGVKRVWARLIPTKSATVVYDANIITKEEIIQNQVFDLYGVSIISDESFSGSVLPTESQEGVAMPQEIQDKSQQAALLLQQKLNKGKDTSAAQGLFNQVNNDIEQGNFSQAEALLNTIIDILQNL